MRRGFTALTITSPSQNEEFNLPSVIEKLALTWGNYRQ